MLRRPMLWAPGEDEAPWYDGAYVAWQPFGADDVTAARADLTGGGRNITGGGTPSWTAAAGFTGLGAFSEIPNVLTGGAFTALWAGRVSKSYSSSEPYYHSMLSSLVSPHPWFGGFGLHTWTTGLYVGCNSTYTAYRYDAVFGSAFATGDLITVVYRKNADYSQKLFFYNHSTAMEPTPLTRAGTAYNYYGVAPCTCNGGSFRAAAIWREALSDTEIETLLATVGV